MSSSILYQEPKNDALVTKTLIKLKLQSWICLNTTENMVSGRPRLNGKDSFKIFLSPPFPLRQGLVQPRLASNLLCAKDDLEFLILLPSP